MQMSPIHSLGVAVFVAIAFWQFPINAQAPMDSRETNRIGYIAVIDMQRLLTDYKPFTDRQQELREFEQERRGLIAKHAAKIEEKRKQLTVFVVNSPPYKKFINEIYLLESQQSTEEKVLENGVDIAEARLYVTYYEAVAQQVTRFAQRRNITMVLNRSPIKENASDLESAAALFGQKVIYERHVDITSDILDALDRDNVLLPRAELPEPVFLNMKETE